MHTHSGRLDAKAVDTPMSNRDFLIPWLADQGGISGDDMVV
jgi:hypothetical protein